MFTVGNKVTLIVETPTIFHGKKEEKRYSGTVLRSENYDDANTVRITGDHPNVSVRVIPKQWIRSVNGFPFEFKAKPQPKSYTVHGSKNAVYTVIIDPDGSHKCTCAAFQFRGGNCKHIQQKLSESPI